MAGHSKWANIKHRKGRQDAVRAVSRRVVVSIAMVSGKDDAKTQSQGKRDQNLKNRIDYFNRFNGFIEMLADEVAKHVRVGEVDDYQIVHLAVHLVCKNPCNLECFHLGRFEIIVICGYSLVTVV